MREKNRVGQGGYERLGYNSKNGEWNWNRKVYS